MSFRPNFNSITTRLIIMGALLFTMGLLGRIFLLSDYLRGDLVGLSASQLQAISAYVAQDVDRDVLSRRELLEHVAVGLTPDLLRNTARLQAWLDERQDINPLFSAGLFVSDLAGNVLADSPKVPGRIGINIADRDYFQLSRQGALAVGKPVIGRAAKVPVLPMSIPLRDAAGKVYAVLVGISALHSANFLEALYATHVGESGGLVLFSPRDGLFLGASDADLALKPTPQQGWYAGAVPAGKQYRAGMYVRNGGEELVAAAQVPSTGWVVAARIPAAEVYAPLARLRRFIIGNTVYMIPLFFLIMVLAMRYLLRPLTDAARHADRMTREEIPLEPLPVVRDDEVGHLTQAFNRVLSKLIESRSELQHIAHHDILTGLPNRKLLEDRVQQALLHAQRSKGSVALLFLDLDGFKPINDSFGHEAGDQALREVAQRLQGVVRREDTLARVGGDEFVILLADLQLGAHDVAARVAEKCLAVFAEPFMIRGQACHLGGSIGIALGGGECEADKLLIAADQAMYQAKEQGRGRLVFSAGGGISTGTREEA